MWALRRTIPSKSTTETARSVSSNTLVISLMCVFLLLVIFFYLLSFLSVFMIYLFILLYGVFSLYHFIHLFCIYFLFIYLFVSLSSFTYIFLWYKLEPMLAAWAISTSHVQRKYFSCNRTWTTQLVDITHLFPGCTLISSVCYFFFTVALTLGFLRVCVCVCERIHSACACVHVHATFKLWTLVLRLFNKN